MRILKGFKSNDFGSADCKGVTSVFSVSADSKDVRTFAAWSGRTSEQMVASEERTDVSVVPSIARRLCRIVKRVELRRGQFAGVSKREGCSPARIIANGGCGRRA